MCQNINKNKLKTTASLLPLNRITTWHFLTLIGYKQQQEIANSIIKGNQRIIKIASRFLQQQQQTKW